MSTSPAGVYSVYVQMATAVPPMGLVRAAPRSQLDLKFRFWTVARDKVHKRGCCALSSSRRILIRMLIWCHDSISRNLLDALVEVSASLSLRPSWHGRPHNVRHIWNFANVWSVICRDWSVAIWVKFASAWAQGSGLISAHRFCTVRLVRS